MKQSNSHSGFTTVELIVVIMVAASFIASISQMISFVSGTAADARNQEVASNLAYNNLRKYANGKSALWFTCTTATNGKTTPRGQGQILINDTSQTPLNGLPAPVRQKVTAFAPYGCANTDSGMPVRVISEISYGTPAKEVVHATYVSR